MQRRVKRGAVFGLFALVAGACGDGDVVPNRGPEVLVDAGVAPLEDGSIVLEDGAVPLEDSSTVKEADAGRTVLSAPAGTSVAPAVTVMSSGQFRLEGAMSLGIAAGTTSASEKHELRGASISGR